MGMKLKVDDTANYNRAKTNTGSQPYLKYNQMGIGMMIVKIK